MLVCNVFYNKLFDFYTRAHQQCCRISGIFFAHTQLIACYRKLLAMFAKRNRFCLFLFVSISLASSLSDCIVCRKKVTAESTLATLNTRQKITFAVFYCRRLHQQKFLFSALMFAFFVFRYVRIKKCLTLFFIKRCLIVHMFGQN